MESYFSKEDEEENKAFEVTWGQFQQHVYAQLLCLQISKVQRDSQVIRVFLRFWDLCAQKLLIKCCKNKTLKKHLEMSILAFLLLFSL